MQNMVKADKKYELTKRTFLFILLFLTAGICNLLTRSGSAFLDTLMFSANFMIYAGLLLFWIHSVRSRLLPTKARSYILSSAILMFFFLMIRIFKYRIIIHNAPLKRYADYLYWLPFLLIPALFLMTAICIQRGKNGERRIQETWILIPSLFFFLLVMTNDLHSFVYIPKTALPALSMEGDTYSYGIDFYILLAWIIILFLAGVVTLFHATKKQTGNIIMCKLLAVLAVWICFELVLTLVLKRYDMRCMYQSPEIRCFGMLAIYEICIRHRLIPHNENYEGFFEKLSLPVLITDRAQKPVYRSALPVNASENDLTKALRAPLYPDDHTRLSGMDLGVGYAFWTEDETELRKERRRLASAHELLSEENDLIALENKLRKQKACLDAKTRIYHDIAVAIYPKQKQIEALLAQIEPDSEAFPNILARCCMLNAWSKRKSNLLLLSEEPDKKYSRELFLALQESVRSLKCCGVEAAAVGNEYADFPLTKIIDLYDSFETVIETFLPFLKRMTVSLAACGVRMAMETEQVPELPETKLPVACIQSDGITYLTVSVKKEGA